MTKKPETIRGFKPLADKRSRILILGTAPSPASLARREYYGLPQNAFWRILFDLFGVGAPGRMSPPTYEQKICLLKENHIALWDVIGSCVRTGASDHSIKNVEPNDVAEFIRKHPSISTIFLNGHKAEKLFHKHFRDPIIERPAYYLPSTSPAHASMTYKQKLKAWSIIKRYLGPMQPWC